MSDEWRFRGNVYSALQAKADALAEVIRMLREDYPLTADDKKAVAEFIEWLTAPGKRGRPAAKVFTAPWHKQRIVGEARRIAIRDSITHFQAALHVLRRDPQGCRFTVEEIVQELKRQR
jgi:hypothetical protein